MSSPLTLDLAQVVVDVLDSKDLIGIAVSKSETLGQLREIKQEFEKEIEKRKTSILKNLVRTLPQITHAEIDELKNVSYIAVHKSRDRIYCDLRINVVFGGGAIYMNSDKFHVNIVNVDKVTVGILKNGTFAEEESFPISEFQFYEQPNHI